jgi:hypothetical protein
VGAIRVDGGVFQAPSTRAFASIRIQP